MKYIAQFLMREVVRRKLPHGLVHWRYALPGQPESIRIHRHLWRQGQAKLPRPLRWALEIWLYSRWTLFGAWLSTWRCVRRWGANVQSQEGISIARQTWRVLRLSLTTCLPAFAIYQLRLYRDSRRVWDYVYDHELLAFHRGRSQALQPNSVALLQDKFRLSEHLSTHGIPVAEILAIAVRGESINFSPYLQRYPRLFCKRRQGSCAKGAFFVARGSDELHPSLHSFEGEMIPASNIEQFLRKQLAQTDYLIQPYLENHPALAKLTDSGEAITVRLITEQTVTQCYSAAIEIPVRSRNAGVSAWQQYVILPIDLQTGVIQPMIDDKIPFDALPVYRAIGKQTQDMIIPCWQELRASALTAHQLFPDIFAIAWDFVVTPDGPLLLEGNTSWSAMLPQIFHGGLFLKEPLKYD